MNYFDVLLAKKLEDDRDPKVEGLSVTENGRYHEDGVVYDPVIVNVPETPLSKLTVTENGTYIAPTGTGYSEVDVDVPLPENAYLLKEIEDVEIASFDDGSDLPMPKLEVAIEPVQSGSGDPSPTNIRPISGWDEVNVSVSGVNVWDEEWEVGDISGTTGVNEPSSTNIRSTNYIQVKPNVSYYFRSPNQIKIRYYDRNKEFISGGVISNNAIITISEQTYYIRFAMPNAYGTTYNNDISINYPSTDTSYHAYNGQVYTIDLDGTRYGGKVDLVSGVLTVDRGMLTLNGSEEYYSIQSSSADDNTVLRVATGQVCKQNENQKSNYGTYNNNAWQPLASRVNTFVLGSEGNLYLQIPSSTASTVEEFKALFASNPLQVCYELTTPITIQLTPTAVKSLLGSNNVYADTGNILDLSYLAKEV